MKGLDIARGYFLEYGKPMIEEGFARLVPLLAFGLAGEGSECFGFDDEISKDHDFEPGFCIFTPDPDKSPDFTRRDFFELERAYSYLPKEYRGQRRLTLAPEGGSRHGVMTISDFYIKHTGKPAGFENALEWFTVPDHYLAQATNGEVFEDNLGEFTRIRSSLLNMPEDVRRKKLAGHLTLAGQSGQYNYQRCIKHGQTAAAQLSVFNFANHIMAAMFLAERRYMPFYKWSFAALARCQRFSSCADELEFLISTQNDGGLPIIKEEVIDSLCSRLLSALREEGLCSSGEITAAAREINSGISDPYVRSLDLLFAV